MENELISMTCNIFNNENGYGITTTGGTESIFLGMLAHREYALKKGKKDVNM